MSQPSDRYVFDTSAWLTFIEDEAGADHVQELLEQARNGECVIYVSFMSFMEVYYITLQERREAEAQERVALMAALPVLRVEMMPTYRTPLTRRGTRSRAVRELAAFIRLQLQYANVFQVFRTTCRPLRCNHVLT